MVSLLGITVLGGADSIVFARIGASGRNPQETLELFPADYHEGDDYYLIDPPPGLYIAVAAYFLPVREAERQEGAGILRLLEDFAALEGAQLAPEVLEERRSGRKTGFLLYFSKAMSQASAQSLAGGEVVFLGRYSLGLALGNGFFSDWERHFYAVIPLEKLRGRDQSLEDGLIYHLKGVLLPIIGVEKEEINFLSHALVAFKDRPELLETINSRFTKLRQEH